MAWSMGQWGAGRPAKSRPAPLDEAESSGGRHRFPPWAWKTAAWAVAPLAVWAIAATILPSGLPFGIVLLGVLLGGLNSLTAIGLVLIYRSARIVNFAQADMGGLAAAAAVVMVTGAHLPYLLALPLGLAVAVATGYVVDATIIRRFFRAPRLILTVATIGVAQVLGAGELGMPKLFSHLSPLSTFTTPFKASTQIGPVVFDGNDFLALAVVPLVLVALWWFVGRTDTGVAIRAAADSDERALLLGIPVRRLSMVSWMVAAGLSGVTAMLSAPILGPNLDAVAGPVSLLAPLGAAVIAGMESMPVAFFASIGIGVFEQAVLWSYPRSTAVNIGLFGFVLVALAVRRRSLGRSGRSAVQSALSLVTGSDRPIPEALRRLPEVRVAKLAAGAVVLAAAVFLPVGMSAQHQILLNSIVVFAIVAVSLTVLAGWAGQISLGQFAFVGIGAACTGALLVHARADLFVALLASTAVGAVAAALLGAPSLRIPGLFLAVVTMAFGVPVATWLLDSSYFPTLNPSIVPRPLLFGRVDLHSPLALFEFSLAVLVVVLVLARNFRHSRVGRTVVAVRDNDQAAASYGISPARAKLAAFTFSGALAGLAGGLYVVSLEGMPFAGFNPEKSIVVFTMVVIGGLGSLTGAVIGAVYVEGAQYFLTGAAQLLATGAGLLVLLLVVPGGLGQVMLRLRDRALLALARARQLEVPVLLRTGMGTGGAPVSGNTAEAEAPAVATLELPLQGNAVKRGLTRVRACVGGSHSAKEGTTLHQPGATALSCSDVDAGYGLLKVLFSAHLGAGSGEVLALLGTNGAGKSTLLKVLAGVLPASKGRVELFGEDITGWSPERRVAAGLVMMPGGHGVFPSLTVRENLRVATWLWRKEQGGAGDRVGTALDLFPSLRRRLPAKAVALSGGEQQMLALAQALICRPKVLLVDELSLGLAPVVVGELIDVLREMRDSGTTVVLVEQSLNIAASIAPRAVFMERGEVRFDGRTGELLDREDLARAVFLGSASMRDAAIGDGAEREAAVGNGAVRERGNGRVAGTFAFAGSGQPAAMPPNGSPEESRFGVYGVSVAFGGVTVLRSVTLEAAPGEIVGIIGANGAGKTTLFDVCSGFVTPGAGRVILGGTDVTHLGAPQRALLGLGRIFQDARLFPSMTVFEATLAAADRHLEVREPLACALGLGAARDSEGDARGRAEELVAASGLGTYRDATVAELSTGTRRMVELAGLMAFRPAVLLADEPSSGIAQREVEALRGMLAGIRDSTGATLIVIEHDIPMIAAIADRLVCLHLGEVIAEGRPQDVLDDPLVISSYLGTDPAAVQRSGGTLLAGAH